WRRAAVAALHEVSAAHGRGQRGDRHVVPVTAELTDVMLVQRAAPLPRRVRTDAEQDFQGRPRERRFLAVARLRGNALVDGPSVDAVDRTIGGAQLIESRV